MPPVLKFSIPFASGSAYNPLNNMDAAFLLNYCRYRLSITLNIEYTIYPIPQHATKNSAAFQGTDQSSK